MTNTKHTPGPWHIHDTEPFTVCGPDGDSVAGADAFKRSMEENGANARLIAAAPELLMALIWLVDLKAKKDAAGKNSEYEEEKILAWAGARAAILKAVGENVGLAA
jgi:hypothetical protein